MTAGSSGLLALVLLSPVLAGCASPSTLLPFTVPAKTLAPIALVVCPGRPALPATATDCPQGFSRP